jgi:hypothetical protein
MIIITKFMKTRELLKKLLCGQHDNHNKVHENSRATSKVMWTA